MNIRLIFSLIGRILKMEGVILLLPILVVLIDNEPWINILSFLVPALLSFSVGQYLSREQDDYEGLYAMEGFIIVALSWILLSLFGSLPYLISGELQTFGDAFFETVSGFTTTGATVFNDVEIVRNSILFWRSLTQWLGGMGILVFALAILPQSQSQSVYIMRAEVPGMSFGRLYSRVSSSARMLYIFYVVLTIVTIIFLMFGGIPFFESTLLGFGAAATGGFSQVNANISVYNSAYIEMVLSFAMLAFGINFNLYYLLYNRNYKEVLKSEELRWYLGIIGIATLMMSLNLIFNNYDIVDSLRHSFFSVSSVITTTAYLTEDYTLWPVFSRVVLLLLMFVGGMSGSTAGGLKVSRIAILIKTALSEIKHLTYPNRVVSVHFEGQALRDSVLKSVVNYFVVYTLIFVIALVIVSLEIEHFLSAFSTVVSMLNNIGTGFGVVGPSYNYSFFSQPLKFFLSFLMIMGRLEIYPILIFLSPTIWRRSFNWK